MWVIKNTYRLLNESDNTYTNWQGVYLNQRVVTNNLPYNVWAGIGGAAQFKSKAAAVRVMRERGMRSRGPNHTYEAVKLD